MPSLNIGITIVGGKKSVGELIWTNGNNQTPFYLYKLLLHTKHHPFLVVISQEKTNESVFNGVKLHYFDDIKNDLNIMILHGAEISAEDARYLVKKKCKLIKFVGGNYYVITMESILFRKNVESIPDSTKIHNELIEEIWTIPQHEKTCYHFNEVLMKKPVKIVPHIWHPFFLDNAKHCLENINDQDYQVTYQKTNKQKKRVSIFEQNLNIVKCALIPILIVEKMYRNEPQLLEKLYVTNTDNLKKKAQFIRFLDQLDIFNDNKIELAGRYPIAYWLAKYTDVCVIHQWENAMNNMYLDALYFNYPLIHNSFFWKDYGYYYPEFNLDKGAEVLAMAIKTHDQNIEAYQYKSQDLLWQHHTDNPSNIAIFENLLSSFESKTAVSSIHHHNNRDSRYTNKELLLEN